MARVQLVVERHRQIGNNNNSEQGLAEPTAKSKLFWLLVWRGDIDHVFDRSPNVSGS
jgi:hypothetical protein